MGITCLESVIVMDGDQIAVTVDAFKSCKLNNPIGSGADGGFHIGLKIDAGMKLLTAAFGVGPGAEWAVDPFECDR